MTLQVSGTALLISMFFGIPAGIFLGLRRFKGRRLGMALLYTGMGFPPAVMAVDPGMRLQMLSLGATDRQAVLTLLWEARLGVVVAIAAGFGSIISEVGAVLLVGGNIAGRTRVMTTAIVLETRKGNFDLALTLGVILLSITFLVNLVMLRLQGRLPDE